MSTVFIGGSRSLSRLDEPVRARLDAIVGAGCRVVVGDADGVDRAVQEFLSRSRYARVEVFCSGGFCRNNLGRWNTRSIAAPRGRRTYRFFAAKDRAMADEATYGLMVWDGESTGTLLNVLRLLRKDKTADLHAAPGKSFAELGSMDRWRAFLAAQSPEARRDYERKAAMETKPQDESGRQSGLPLHTA